MGVYRDHCDNYGQGHGTAAPEAAGCHRRAWMPERLAVPNDVKVKMAADHSGHLRAGQRSEPRLPGYRARRRLKILCKTCLNSWIKPA